MKIGVFKKVSLLILAMIIGVLPLKGQKSSDDKDDNSLKNRDFKDRLVFGGNLGLSFGNYTSINVSPKIGYMLNKRWMAGIGGTYHYLKIDNRYGVYEDQIYGGEIFTNYRVFKNFIVLGELELMNVKTQPVFSNEPYRTWQPGTFLGIGYRQGVGGSVYVDLQLKYNFSYRPGISPYSEPYVFNISLFFL